MSTGCFAIKKKEIDILEMFQQLHSVYNGICEEKVNIKLFMKCDIKLMLQGPWPSWRWVI